MFSVRQRLSLYSVSILFFRPTPFYNARTARDLESQHTHTHTGSVHKLVFVLQNVSMTRSAQTFEEMFQNVILFKGTERQHSE